MQLVAGEPCAALARTPTASDMPARSAVHELDRNTAPATLSPGGHGQQIDRLRVAIVHEWLDTYAGSERVLEQLLACFPGADLFAVVDFMDEAERGFLRGRPVHTSFIQRLPLARRRFRDYLSLMPLAIQQLDLSGYDLVISSNHAVAKGVLTGPNQLHISYMHSPMRYAWDLQHQYPGTIRFALRTARPVYALAARAAARLGRN